MPWIHDPQNVSYTDEVLFISSQYPLAMTVFLGVLFCVILWCFQFSCVELQQMDLVSCLEQKWTTSAPFLSFCFLSLLLTLAVHNYLKCFLCFITLYIHVQMPLSQSLSQSKLMWIYIIYPWAEWRVLASPIHWNITCPKVSTQARLST